MKKNQLDTFFIKKEAIMSKISKINSGRAKRSELDFIPFFNDLIIMSIIKVEAVKIEPDAGNNYEPSQILVFCAAMDSLGFVFKSTLMFTTTSVKKKNKIISDMKEDAIYLVKGRYNISENNVVILDPKYVALPESFNGNKVRKVFRVNSKIH